MHEKWFKIDFFCKFSKTSEKIAYLQKKYAEILRTGGAIVRNVEKKSKINRQNFFWFHFWCPRL